eukprot:scaffold8033_cov15-Tisochrysis_lutea.AAC.1
MSRLRHPNIVLFLGAVIQPTQLAIVSEFVPRGSLFRLLHRSRAHIEPKRLLLMAMDIARGVCVCVHRSRSHIEPKRLLLMAMDITRGVCGCGCKCGSVPASAARGHGHSQRDFYRSSSARDYPDCADVVPAAPLGLKQELSVLLIVLGGLVLVIIMTVQLGSLLLLDSWKHESPCLSLHNPRHELPPQLSPHGRAPRLEVSQPTGRQGLDDQGKEDRDWGGQGLDDQGGEDRDWMIKVGRTGTGRSRWGGLCCA